MDRLHRSTRGRLLTFACTLFSLSPQLASAQAATPARADGAEVSLAALLRFAEQHAPALQVATRRRAYARAAHDDASPWLRGNPTLELGAGPRFDGAHDSGYDLHASLEQPVEIAGQRSARLALADRMRTRLEREVGASRWELYRQVALGYREAAVARERVAAAVSVVGFCDELLAIARKRYDAGDIGVIDVHLAESDSARARQAHVLAEQQLLSARLDLSELTGWPIADPPLPSSGLPPPGSVPSLERALATARKQHPELLALRAAVAEANAQRVLAERDAWPTPSLGIEFTREGSLTERENYVLLGTVALPLPFWQRAQGERSNARAQAEVAQAEEHAAAAALVARVARAHGELRAAAVRVQILADGVTASLEGTLALLRKGFAAGEIPIFQVALARERFLAARQDTLAAYSDYYRALAELESATGEPLTSEETP